MFNRRAFFEKAIPLGLEDTNTPLHKALDGGINPEELTSLIETLGEIKASDMSRIINDNGYLPIDLIKTKGEKEKNEFYNILIPLMIQLHFKPLSEKLDSKQFDAYISHRRLYENLQFACLAVNKVRSILKESETHPQTNSYTNEDKEQLRNRTLKLAEIKRDRIKKISSDYYIHQPMETRIKIVECIAKIYEEAKTGNCDAASFIAFNHLIQSNYPNQIEVFQIIGGDHIFLVLDRDPLSSPEDYKTWGENAVVCDPWSGEVYPASEIPSRLRNFEHYKTSDHSYVNVVTSLNLKSHQLGVCFSAQQAKNQNVQEFKLKP